MSGAQQHVAPDRRSAPKLPPGLEEKNAYAVAPDADGLWWMWEYIWGEPAGLPTLVGRDRAEALRTVRQTGDKRPGWIEGSL